MCGAREPRRFNGLCDTCCWFGHLSCDCLLQRDRVYSDVPTLSSPPQSNRGGPGYDIPCYPPQQPAPHSPPQYSGPHCYRAKPFVRRYSGGDGTALSPQQQPAHAPSLALSETRGTTAATVQRRSSSQPHAPSLALSETRGTTAATVQRRRSSQPHAPSLALSRTRGTTAATVQRRSSSQAPAPSVPLAGSRGALAAMDRR